uniref:Uncharacterized protein n=1 Tax=Plectus sambesii TaxID=2011161 RepID=A0A914WUI6_9BILA
MIWETRRKLRQLMRSVRPETQQKTFQELTENRFRGRVVLFVLGWSVLGLSLLKYLFERVDPVTGKVIFISPNEAKKELWTTAAPKDLFTAISEKKQPRDTNAYELDD